MNVDVVDLSKDRIEKLLKVDLIKDELMGKLFDEPSINVAVKGLDLAVGRRIARARIDSADAQDGQALTEHVGVVGRSTIHIEAQWQAVTACGLPEDRDSGSDRLRRNDKAPQRVAGRVVDQGNETKSSSGPIHESHTETCLGVSMPDLMRVLCLEALPMPPPTLGPTLVDLEIPRMSFQCCVETALRWQGL